jgi:hypothetical protein
MLRKGKNTIGERLREKLLAWLWRCQVKFDIYRSNFSIYICEDANWKYTACGCQQLSTKQMETVLF